MDTNKIYYLNDIYQRFIQPYFLIKGYGIYLEINEILKIYKFVVTPNNNLKKFISLLLIQHNKIDDSEVRIIYTNIDAFDNYYDRNLNFLLDYDDVTHFNTFYQDFVNELGETERVKLHHKIIHTILNKKYSGISGDITQIH